MAGKPKPEEERRKMISIRLDQNTIHALGEVSKKEGVTKTRIIERAIKKFIVSLGCIIPPCF